jgi:DNA-binding transcriptional regulator YiaG
VYFFRSKTKVLSGGSIFISGRLAMLNRRNACLSSSSKNELAATVRGPGIRRRGSNYNRRRTMAGVARGRGFFTQAGPEPAYGLLKLLCTIMAKSKDRSSAVEPADQLSSDDIRRIREGLGLTQVEAGELLGGGPRAFTKYEGGSIKPSASIVKLLRLLESDPQALKTLTGGRFTAIESNTPKPLEVTSDHIATLSPRRLSLLVERLLTAEAYAGGLPMDGIHVAAQIPSATAARMRESPGTTILIAPSFSLTA